MYNTSLFIEEKRNVKPLELFILMHNETRFQKMFRVFNM